VIEEIARRLAVYAPREIEEPGRPRASVLVPLYRHQGALHVILTRRSDEVEHHKGEISFPGGAFEQTDSDLSFTALRECHEEIGLLPQQVRILGRLDDLVTVSCFLVAVYVGVLDDDLSPFEWVTQPSEVAEVLEVPLLHLTERRNVIEVPRLRNGELVVSEGFQFGEHTIWGATARMLRNFLDVAVEQPAAVERPV
jgi:8-oxo-dGTP pyrophosphatase MutT (NUDIX family)